MNVLLANGANANINDNKGNTPLILGILRLNCFFKLLFWKNLFTVTKSYQGKDDLDLIELLLKNGANVNRRDNTGTTALHYSK